MARPMEEWLNQPENREQMGDIVTEVTRRVQRGEVPWADGPALVNTLQSQVREIQMAEAPDEYLEPEDLELRIERRKALENPEI